VELLRNADDLHVLYELATEEADPQALQELTDEVRHVGTALDRLELITLLSGPDDDKNCYFNIQAGAGGTESCDWAEMLLRMYLHYFERNDYQAQELSRKDGEEAGIQSISLLVSGAYACGYLSCETGVHRLVRISPFNFQGRRHTSFASVDVLPEFEEIRIEINWDNDVREETFRASGAGGQHVNKTSSAIRLTHVGTGIVVQCQNQRSQHKNRATARKILQSRLYRLEQQKRDADLAKLYGEKGEIAWGNQIRSYVLHPYQLVKDHRTGYQTSDTQSVLDGHIQPFIEHELRRRAASRAAGSAQTSKAPRPR
jgi:peptide chain release factor 2